MTHIPDFNDPRYLNEVGWFLHREKYGYNHFTASYAKERLVWSEMLLDEFVEFHGKKRDWVRDKTVVTIGCGCTGDLAAWPAAAKIAVDPLLYVYQQLGMLIEDAPNTTKTIFLPASAEEIPLLDEIADVAICRNALDHMLDPKMGWSQMRRILKSRGAVYLSVDIGGEPTPDEPSPFTRESVMELAQDGFEVLRVQEEERPHDEWREASVRILAEKKGQNVSPVSKEEILRAYELLLSRGGG